MSKHETPTWTVTRQCHWPDGKNVVEISHGTLDYANPDALAQKYKGELQEYHDPREAVTVAIQIAQQWKRDYPGLSIHIDHGATCGFTMPFDGMPMGAATYSHLGKWAKLLFEKLPKCEQCGEPLGKERWKSDQYDDEYNCCSEYCAEKKYEWEQKEQQKFEMEEAFANSKTPEEVEAIREQYYDCLEGNDE